MNDPKQTIGSGAGTEPPWPNPAYAWYVVLVLYLCAIMSFVDRQIIALVVEDIKVDLGLTDLHIGLLQGPPFGIFYAVMAMPIALAADRQNRRNIIVAGITFWSMATAACGMAGSFWHLFLARIGVGVGEASLGPSAYSIISDYFPKQKLSLAMAVFTMGNLTGVGLAMLLGGALIVALKAIGPVELWLIGTLQPWQFTFVLVAIPGVILAALVSTIREPVRRGQFEAAAAQGTPRGARASSGGFSRPIGAPSRRCSAASRCWCSWPTATSRGWWSSSCAPSAGVPARRDWSTAASR